jgi:hypothetical protein
VKDETATRFDRTAMMHREVGRLAGVDAELGQQTAKAQASSLVADADSNRAILVVDADRDDGPFEARVGHPGHCEKQLAGQKLRRVHASKMDSAAARGKP